MLAPRVCSDAPLGRDKAILFNHFRHSFLIVNTTFVSLLPLSLIILQASILGDQIFAIHHIDETHPLAAET